MLVDDVIDLRSLRDLSPETEKFLTLMPKGNDKSAVYFRSDDGRLLLVRGVNIPNIDYFEMQAPVNLYRGVVLLNLRTKYGQVMVYDEQHKRLRSSAENILPEDGQDLSRAMNRSVINGELVVIANNGKDRLVPRGFYPDPDWLRLPGWDHKVKHVRTVGEIYLGSRNYDHEHRIVEFLTEWGIPRDYSSPVVLSTKHLSNGGQCGAVAFVVNRCGEVEGIFNGRDGYVSIPEIEIHAPFSCN